MTRPADMPGPERWPHGVRARYVTGCRCDDCRRANREYVAKRTRENIYGRRNPLVNAAPVRAHLLELRQAGLGRRAVADAADVREGTVGDVARGVKTKIRWITAKALLSVTTAAMADGALVDAAPTWRLVEDLQRAGFTKKAIAHALGAKMPALQLGRDKVLSSTAQRVRLLHVRLLAEKARAEEIREEFAELTFRTVDIATAMEEERRSYFAARRREREGKAT